MQKARDQITGFHVSTTICTTMGQPNGNHFREYLRSRY
jgi:hypothetical protein